jgi:hypothetical protein
VRLPDRIVHGAMSTTCIAAVTDNQRKPALGLLPKSHSERIDGDVFSQIIRWLKEQGRLHARLFSRFGIPQQNVAIRYK